MSITRNSFFIFRNSYNCMLILFFLVLATIVIYQISIPKKTEYISLKGRKNKYSNRQTKHKHFTIPTFAILFTKMRFVVILAELPSIIRRMRQA